MANLLSKVKIGAETYDLKDAYARTEIAKLGTAALRNVAAAISDGDGKIADAAMVKAYVDAQVGALHNFTYQIVTELPTPSADTMYIIYLKANGDSTSGNSYDEYITVENSGSYTFEKIGSTDVDLSGYVPTARTIAGLALSANITKAALQSALDLGDMAYADSAKASYGGASITGVKATASNIDVDIDMDPLHYTSTTITSTGTIKGQTEVSGTIAPTGTVTATASQKSAAATISTSDYTPAGDVSVTLSNATVLGSVASAGTLPSVDTSKFNGGTAATLGAATKSAFNTDAMKVHMDTADTEMLVFEAAATAQAVTEQGTFNGGTAASISEGFFTAGAMPTFSNATVGVQSASFTGTKETGLKVTGVTYQQVESIDATFAGEAIDASEAITAEFKNIDVQVTGSYDKADAVTGKATINSIESTVDTITVPSVVIEVLPEQAG